MPAVLKGRSLTSLLLLLILAGRIDARPADARMGKISVAPAPKAVVAPAHTPRPLSRWEIFRAIHEELERAGISGREELRPEDLNIQSSVLVRKEDTGLQVKRIGFDPIRRVTFFDLWTSHEPQYLPFEVTTRRDPQSFGLTAHPERNRVIADGILLRGNSEMDQKVSGAMAKLPVLVRPGRSATLVMLGENVRITTMVVPLQPGSKGQSILVRDPITARVMTAEVVDAGQLQTSF